MTLDDWTKWAEIATGFGTLVLALITAIAAIIAAKALRSGDNAADRYVRSIACIVDQLKNEIEELRKATTEHVGAMSELSTVTLRTAQTAALAHYQSRYEHLVEKRDALTGAESRKAKPEDRYFEAFWTLHLEEWMSFRRGLIEPDIFRHWLHERHEEFRVETAESRKLFTQGWTKWRRGHAARLEPRFVRTINRLMVEEVSDGLWERICAKDARDLDEALAHDEI